MFQKILIANRGEIAVRVIRACRELGIRTVAVFSEADRAATHVRFADQAYAIGPAPSAESYLRIDRILEAARASGAEAIHPGYGFLAENPAFPAACEEAGITFIGPSARTLTLCGSKTAARRLAQQAGVPTVPGTDRDLSDEEVTALAPRIGFPLLIKAAAGGGGKGMRVVREPGELPSALRAARSEGQSSFGDSAVYLEKYLERPRHIEMQILADRAGQVVYLGERECSIQRRHQKVVEEAPSPFVDEALRRKIGEAAVAIARAAGYRNAGTVEFLVDRDRSFYFLEVNARLQVEHPVTEMVTGLDLVKAQIAIAAGGPAPVRQEEVRLRGHAIECRIYAEDPFRNFLPSPGRIVTFRRPGGPGVRDDTGVYEGYDVPVHYDPLIAKLITWGESRAEAIQRMRRALQEYIIIGIQTTIPFHRQVMEDPAFLAGEVDTTYVDAVLATLRPPPGRNRKAAIIAAALHAYLQDQEAALARPQGPAAAGSRWLAAARQEAVRRR
ncbi:MAG TPA: acetyl-CoA carboxylase biotin carboxylase subunit [Candidatus Methylomirabilis sp.]|nr:acetyl-CoA carboxylase biotin carboxylase subunit [Candidatus Methylomirabilis sp.]